MRLELEQNHLQAAFPSHMETEISAEERAARAAEHLRIGIKAAQLGNRAAARISLVQATELDPRNESAWLWLSSISEYPEELLAFLNNVLDINPNNPKALEWSAATRSLLARNFVQRGIDAAESNQLEMAAQHFNQALEYDERNSLAWLWLASLAESDEGKLSYFEKALEFDPENEAALAGYARARNDVRQRLLNEARAAAVAGDSEHADQLLDAIISEEPEAEDAWMLRSHISPDFAGKVAALRRVIEINPDNAGARATLDSLTSILSAVSTVPPVSRSTDPFDSPQAVEEFDASGDQPAEAEQSAVAEDVPAEELFSHNGTAEVDDFAGFEQMPMSFDGAAESNSFDETFFGGSDETNWQELESDTFQPDMDEDPEETPEIIEYEMVPEVAEVSSNEHRSNVVFLRPQENESREPAPVGAPPTEDFNPFHSAEFRAQEDDGFKTLVSIELDAETMAAIQSYDLSTTEQTAQDASFNAAWSEEAPIAAEIPMPKRDLEEISPAATGFETYVVESSNEKLETAAVASCPFCHMENDAQAITCHGCFSVLTLADLELVLANSSADKSVVRRAVAEMERERLSREFTESELTLLGLGHLNLRNFQFGYNYLLEASQKNPNNVVLSGQVNALLIRLEEIRKQEEIQGSMVRGKTILVVDDSPTVRKLIAGKLEKSGHEVHCSSDGIEAMDRLAILKPDLVLLDINMPRMDGYQVCKLIRSNEATKDVPVVMISGKDGFFDKVRGRMAGTSGYITKPFGPETLMKAVESYLKDAD